eukprot:1153824-Prymnesium_polylepis.1
MGNLVPVGSLVPGYQHQPRYRIRPNQACMYSCSSSPTSRSLREAFVRVMFDISCAILPRLAVRPPIWAHFNCCLRFTDYATLDSLRGSSGGEPARAQPRARADVPQARVGHDV